MCIYIYICIYMHIYIYIYIYTPEAACLGVIHDVSFKV